MTSEPAPSAMTRDQLEAEVVELRAWKQHIVEHEILGKRPFSDRLAQAVTASQVREIDRLQRSLSGLPVRLGECVVALRPFALAAPHIGDGLFGGPATVFLDHSAGISILSTDFQRALSAYNAASSSNSVPSQGPAS